MPLSFMVGFNMKKCLFFEKSELPIIPDGAQFLLGTMYSKIVGDILYRWIDGEWQSTNESYEVFNHYYELELSEYNLGNIVWNVIRNNYKSSFKLDTEKSYHVFRDWDLMYKISIYEPIEKGHKCGRVRYSGGECIVIGNEYPQLDELVGDDIVLVKPSRPKVTTLK